MNPTIEIEQRYKITDVERMVTLLAQQGAQLRDEQHIIDKWFIPCDIHTREAHDQWFDETHGRAYRIRTIVGEGATADEVILDSKQHTAANDHNTFQERIIMRGDEAAMRDFLEQEAYYNWLTIDKRRRRFDSPDPRLVIVMDSVAGVKEALGIDTVLEVEYGGDASREDALQVIRSFAAALGLAEEQRFAKSLTVEAMRVLARFV